MLDDLIFKAEMPVVQITDHRLQILIRDIRRLFKFNNAHVIRRPII